MRPGKIPHRHHVGFRCIARHFASRADDIASTGQPMTFGQRGDNFLGRAVAKRFHRIDVAGQGRSRPDLAGSSGPEFPEPESVEKTYATGRHCAEDFKKTMKILFDTHLPKWNDRVLPESG